jgi:hypothetical protein
MYNLETFLDLQSTEELVNAWKGEAGLDIDINLVKR